LFIDDTDINIRDAVYIVMANTSITVRHQRKNQNARQATMISGLSTIYRNQSMTHSIQTHQQSEPRIFMLDITLEDMNKMYAKIHAIIEKGRLRPKGTEVFFVYKKREHLIFSDDAIYEIKKGAGLASGPPVISERIPVDGDVTTVELSVMSESESASASASDEPTRVKNSTKSFIIPLLVDESYYKFMNQNTTAATAIATSWYISPNHIVNQYTKIVVKLHPKAMTSFVFMMNENETEVLDFYFITENGIIQNSNDKITKTCRDDIISFIDHFKLCS
jgi:hypothetical protein